ncbi:MAG: hypothetical protein KJN97_08930 [Deltaproteobacteria bacterium]|nr:hypothetical protein [Deltaproteobacteria bacterium]
MSEPDDIDIQGLLAAALDEAPSMDLAPRVLARLAGITTVVEFVRLIAVAPLDGLGGDGNVDDDGETT